MAVTPIRKTAEQVFAARTTASTPPTSGDDGFKCQADGGRVRTLIDYTGAVTAAVVRLYTRDPGGTAWFRGVSTTEAGYPLTPASGDESRDWDVGEGVEFTFALESISPSGGAPTVALKVMGVNR